MTLEDKISHLQAASMEEARAEGNAIISSYREKLENVLEEHKETATRQANIRIKAEKVNARQHLNQTLAKSQLDLKRHCGKIQQELKDKVFKEAYELTLAFMRTKGYEDFLLSCIREALEFAGGEPIIIYINASDEERLGQLEKASGVSFTVSTEDFIGGIRAVIRSRNVLIDNSFKTQLLNEYSKFVFSGGDVIA